MAQSRDLAPKKKAKQNAIAYCNSLINNRCLKSVYERGENVVNVLDDILGEPANDEFAAELDKATKPTTPITPEAPSLPGESKTHTKKTSSETKAVEPAKAKTCSENKQSPGQTKIKPKTPASKKTKVSTPKTQPKAKASPSTNTSGSEKPKKMVKSTATKESDKETANTAKEKSVSSPSKVKSEVKPKEAGKVAQKTKSGVKAKVGTVAKVTKTTAKGKPDSSSVDEKKTTTEAAPPVTENSESKIVLKSTEKPATEKKKVVKKVVKKPAATSAKTASSGKTTKPKSSSAEAKEVKQEEKSQENNAEKKPAQSESKKEEKVTPASEVTTDEKSKVVKSETTAKKRPASSKAVAVKAKKQKQEEKKPIKKAKAVAEKKSTAKTEESEVKAKEETKKEQPAEKKEDEEVVVKESESKPDIEMTEQPLFTSKLGVMPLTFVYKEPMSVNDVPKVYPGPQADGADEFKIATLVLTKFFLNRDASLHEFKIAALVYGKSLIYQAFVRARDYHTSGKAAIIVISPLNSIYIKDQPKDMEWQCFTLFAKRKLPLRKLPLRVAVVVVNNLSCDGESRSSVSRKRLSNHLKPGSGTGSKGPVRFKTNAAFIKAEYFETINWSSDSILKPLCVSLKVTSRHKSLCRVLFVHIEELCLELMRTVSIRMNKKFPQLLKVAREKQQIRASEPRKSPGRCIKTTFVTMFWNNMKWIIRKSCPYFECSQKSGDPNSKWNSLQGYWSKIAEPKQQNFLYTGFLRERLTKYEY
ncbi:Hypothetical predicted protein, partial [Paramuricea clavata]